MSCQKQQLCEMQVRNAEEAELFIRKCLEVIGRGFHPDDKAGDYMVIETGANLFTEEQAGKVDSLVAAAFEYADPYKILIDTCWADDNNPDGWTLERCTLWLERNDRNGDYRDEGGAPSLGEEDARELVKDQMAETGSGPYTARDGVGMETGTVLELPEDPPRRLAVYAAEGAPGDVEVMLFGKKMLSPTWTYNAGSGAWAFADSVLKDLTVDPDVYSLVRRELAAAVRRWSQPIQ